MHLYPFSAVVGSDDMALALTLTTISPAVGGVLIRGEKGTAKSTMVRAQAALLPPVTVVDGCRFSCDPAAPDATCPDGPHQPDAAARERPSRLVELPVGAGDDRVTGSLHLEKALTTGQTHFEPGLLAEAHRGVLYVDEVNLLHDHLVDLLLDAAAMGRSSVERDGVSAAHAAKFTLVGTMNPEEGELRPQLLDRFGLTVEVAAPRDPLERVEIIRRRLDFENDPAAFAARFAADERDLAARIADARARLPFVVLGDYALMKIAEICAAFEVDGMRADIVTARAALAHAAWHGREHVAKADIRAAARLSIPHRRRRNPFDAPGIDEDLLDQILGDDEPPEGPESTDPEPTDPGPGDGADSAEEAEAPGAADASDSPEPSRPEHSRPEPSTPEPSSDRGGPAPTGQVAAPDNPYRPRLFTVSGTGVGSAGKRSRAITSSGRTVGVQPVSAAEGPIHLVATIRAAARAGRRSVGPEDLRRARREGREANLILLCVDASGSMAARKRMTQVKTAVMSLLLDAYQRRDKVGLVLFRGSEANLALPPTGSIDIAAARLRELPAGGRTPLAEGLLTAVETLRVERLRDPRVRPLLVVVTDGRATSGPDAMARAMQVADHIAAQDISALVIDSETGRFRLGLAGELARRMRASHVPIGEVSAEAITTVVRGATTTTSRGSAA
ncbi:VWA domain-containing protein [Tomitella biformata]|uniref:VWA domain-containing protein n=1 Tax=Tomitella biformata TaxID=630403 RepID=UPI00046668C0|nr:VWA domain-containing protein [Tomitella biformata]